MVRSTTITREQKGRETPLGNNVDYVRCKSQPNNLRGDKIIKNDMREIKNGDLIRWYHKKSWGCKPVLVEGLVLQNIGLVNRNRFGNKLSGIGYIVEPIEKNKVFYTKQITTTILDCELIV